MLLNLIRYTRHLQAINLLRPVFQISRTKSSFHTLPASHLPPAHPNSPEMAEHDYRSAPTHPVSKRNDGSGHKPHANEESYAAMYRESIDKPNEFWDRVRCALFSPLSGSVDSQASLEPRIVPAGGVDAAQSALLCQVGTRGRIRARAQRSTASDALQ